jgi:hypothetical protein
MWSTDQAGALMTVIDDPAVLDSDPGPPRWFGLAEPVVIAQLLEIARLQAVRRRLVVVNRPRGRTGFSAAPWIASGGIQDVRWTDDSMRMRPSQLTWLR